MIMRNVLYALLTLILTLMWSPTAYGYGVHKDVCLLANAKTVTNGMRFVGKFLVKIQVVRRAVVYVCGLPIAVNAINRIYPYVPSASVAWLTLFGMGAGTYLLFGFVRRLREIAPRSSVERTDENDAVGATVVAPVELRRNEDIMIQVVGNVENALDDEIEKAVSSDRLHQAEEHDRCFFSARRGQRFVFHLSAADLILDEDEQELVWKGKGFRLKFFAHVPQKHKLGGVICELSIQRESKNMLLPVGRIKFMMQVIKGKVRSHEHADVKAQNFTQYFCSFATQDYQSVVDRLQGLSISDPLWDRHVYFYRLAEPGSNWREEEFKYIDNEADVFLLFWSRNAAMSDKVQEEWRQALKRLRKKTPPPRLHAIKPIVIERPMPTPPKELAHIQFLDKTLIMRGG